MRNRAPSQWRRWISVPVAALAVGGLTACDPAPAPPDWAARVTDGAIEIVFCEALPFDELVGYVEQDTDQRWRQFWRADGDVDTERGSSLVAGAAQGGISESIDGEITAESTVLLFAYKGGDRVARTWFEFETASVDAPWAHPGQPATAEPC